MKTGSTSLTHFSNSDISHESINQFYQNESALQLKVKKSIAKLGILSQNEAIYIEGQTVLIDISNLYTPYIGKYLPQLIDLQAEMESITQRSTAFMAKYGTDPFNETDFDAALLAQAKQDLAMSKDINARKLAIMQAASDELVSAYPKIIDLLADLKISMNNHVYRPLVTDQIDEKAFEENSSQNTTVLDHIIN